MRPSSSPSEGLFAGMSARGGAAAEVSDRAWLQAMLDVEAALARSLAARCDARLIDAAEPARSTASAGTPVPGLVRALRFGLPADAALGRSAAHDLVERAAGASSGAGGLRAALLAMPPVVEAIGASGVDAALDPANYLGASGVLIDRALAAHRSTGDGA
jgi:adenylosuccinate lyase